MKRFKVGQKVVALKSESEYGYQPLTKGRVYTILNTFFCQKCGEQFITVVADCPFILGVNNNKHTCCMCRYAFVTGQIYLTRCTFFAPLEEIDHLIQTAIESEDYESACVLRDAKPQTLKQ